MALDANADDLLTLGFTSITAYSKLFGFKANCTLHPPSIFNADIIFIADVRSIWYSLSANVWDGATTILSPVCTPTGSIFSILHIVMQFPFESLITSYSISFHPDIHFSINTWCTLDKYKPLDAISLNSSSVYAIPPPVPPRVYAGLTITGNPILFANSTASSTSVTTLLAIQGSFIDSIISLNACLSSAFFIPSGDVPSSLTLFSFKKPLSYSSIAIFKPVWPPKLGRILSGFSFLIIFSTVFTVIGSIYISSAISLSVIIVAGFEFIKTTSIPSFLNSLQAWVPA